MRYILICAALCWLPLHAADAIEDWKANRAEAVRLYDVYQKARARYRIACLNQSGVIEAWDEMEAARVAYHRHQWPWIETYARKWKVGRR